jgi:hypothetical protein
LVTDTTGSSVGAAVEKVVVAVEMKGIAAPVSASASARTTDLRAFENAIVNVYALILKLQSGERKIVQLQERGQTFVTYRNVVQI